MSVGEWAEGPTSETQYYQYIGFAEEGSNEFFGENLFLSVEKLEQKQGPVWTIELVQVRGPDDHKRVFRVQRELQEAVDEFVADVKEHIVENNGFDREAFAEDHKLVS